MPVRRCSERARNRATVWSALVGLLLAILALVLPAAAAQAETDPPSDGPLRVLVVGDSISQGFGGDATWRYWFWRELVRQGVPIDFVGPDTAPFPGIPTRYESSDPRFDRAHAARAGSTLDYHRSRIDALMTTYAPQVVVVELGLNDARGGDSGSRIASDTYKLLDRVWAHDRTARVVLAEVPVHPSVASFDAAATEANALIASTYANDPRVLLAHNRTDARLRWDPVRFTYDGLHPNATGQTLLAQRFAEAFHRGGLLPQTPQIYRARTWQPNVVPSVRRSGRSITVDWSAAMLRVKMDSVRILVSHHGGRLVPGRSSIGVSARRLTRRLPRGTYDVRLVPRRGTMVGAPGRAVTVRIP